ncbi:Fem1b [Symbiodinium natans]|uniref:Fem1b protein n=1 Tax=Symbiodinium natans TaxID=878477 RepID=A0A812LJF6_9DINO|nr:Fem1b [Symbiodinium natans]
MRHLKEAFHAALKQDKKKLQEAASKYASTRLQTRLAMQVLHKAQYEPIMELHMFPKDPTDVRSAWMVLLVPRSEDIFGQTLFLCKQGRQQDGQKYSCLAQMAFQPLPFRALALLGMWDSAVERLRSTGHVLVAGVGLMFVACLCFGSCIIVYEVAIIICLIFRGSSPTASSLQSEDFLGMELPEAYQITRHVFLFTEPDANSKLANVAPLQVGSQVEVLETRRESAKFSIKRLPSALTSSVRRWIPNIFRTKIWARLKTPEGWIVLFDETWQLANATKADESVSAKYCTHPQLLVQFPAFLRRHVILASSHLAGQWVVMECVPQGFSLLAVFFLFQGCVLIGLFHREIGIPHIASKAAQKQVYGEYNNLLRFVMHAAALYYAMLTATAALEYDEVLETQQVILELGKPVLAVRLVWLAVAVSVVVAASLLEASATSSFNFLTFLTTLILHILDLSTSSSGLDKWRQPQIEADEFTAVASRQLEHTTSGPKTLSKQRAVLRSLASLVSRLCAVSGLAVLMLIVLDVQSTQPQLTRYSFDRGYLQYPASEEAYHNTLVLPADVDSVVFFFEVGAHTSHLFLKCVHPLLEEVEPVLLFSAKDRAERTGEYQLAIPAGPLYSRITVEATGWPKPTVYTVHVIRIGVDKNLAITGSMTGSGGAKIFHEVRSWQHLARTPEWYVPALDMNANITLTMVQKPCAFAPVFVGTSCPLWCSHACSERQVFGIRVNGTNQTVQVVACLSPSLHDSFIQTGHTSDLWSDKEALSAWLGEMLTGLVSLAGSYLSPGLPCRHCIPENVSTTQPAHLLLGPRLELGTAMGPEDGSSGEQIHVRITSEPPAAQLIMNGAGFLFPRFSQREPRRKYVVCCLDTWDSLSATVSDARYEVTAHVESVGDDCSGTVEQKLFTVARRPSAYSPDGGGLYKIGQTVVMTSAQACLSEAMNTDNLSAFHDIGSCIPAERRRQAWNRTAIAMAQTLVQDWRLDASHP